MYSSATGMMPAPMMAATHGPRPRRLEAEQRRARPFRRAENADHRLRHHAELPFGAADQAEKVVAAAVQMLAADLHHGAVQHHQRHPRRLFVVTPYFRQCAPPEFMAMLPATVQASWLDGSGA
jgi:hypothetical protein